MLLLKQLKYFWDLKVIFCECTIRDVFVVNRVDHPKFTLQVKLSFLFCYISEEGGFLSTVWHFLFCLGDT